MSSNIELKIKKLRPEATLPQYATDGSAGLDLTAVDRSWAGDGMTRYYTGLAFEIPAGYVGLLFPRSSIYKMDQTLTNSVGVIDSDYRGEVTAVFRDTYLEYAIESNSGYTIGDRIMQLVLVPIPRVTIVSVDELSTTARGSGGFGSTGK